MDDREQLYDRFLSIAGSPSPPYDMFDEDDLVDIYDYANDNNDEFVKMEVLFYGARVCPGSDRLAIRRTYLYYDLGNDVATTTMLNKRACRTTLSRLLSLRKDVDAGRSVVNGMNEILSRAKELDDEEVIQIVNESLAPEHYQWVKRNVDRIAEKCTYKPTLYYEVSQVARENGDSDYALKMAEELTELEPFNIDFWEFLAEQQYDARKYDACLQSLDYSIAINPNSTKSLVLKGLSMVELGHDPDEAFKILKRAAMAPDIDAACMQPLTNVFVRLGADKAEISEIFNKWLKTAAGFTVAIEGLMIADPVNLDKYRASLKADFLPDDEDFWVVWAERLMREGYYAIAAALLLECISRNSTLLHFDKFLEALYRAGLYDKVEEFYHSDIAVDDIPAAAACTVLAVMACIRQGKLDEARNLVNYSLKPGEKAAVTPEIVNVVSVSPSGPDKEIRALGVKAML